MWTCPNCGEVLEEQFAGSCWRCAKDNPQLKANVESDVPNQSAISEVDLRYKGIKGSLLLLCVILTILAPPVVIVISGINFILANEPDFRKTSTLLKVEGFILLGMACFSFLAGLTLWMGKRYAPKLVKILLLAAFIYTVINLLLFQAYEIPTGQAIFRIIGTGFYAFILYMYLNTSKRVRATYYDSEAAQED